MVERKESGVNRGCWTLVKDDTSQGIVSEGNAKVEVMVRIHGGEFLSQADPHGGA
jgi:hypothetical protein